ncbi:MAG: TIGR03936 family radical SAM-associated protein [Candidatus Omnitrophica bacterium]|nr:TIGR03936 family radical SAM-associated protein [Candidatus Omnitrophota bacterium]
MQTEKFGTKLTIEKSGDMIYFSQLDLASILTRALRRAGLALYYTQGFNPRVKMSFGRALKLGIEGTEEVTIYFTEKISPEGLKQKLLPQMPQGLRII